MYRALQHGKAKQACLRLRALGFPPELVDCGDGFVKLQQVRHDADYDPTYRTKRRDVLEHLETASEAIAKLKRASRKDRLAFFTLLVFDKRP